MMQKGSKEFIDTLEAFERTVNAFPMIRVGGLAREKMDIGHAYYQDGKTNEAFICFMHGAAYKKAEMLDVLKERNALQVELATLRAGSNTAPIAAPIAKNFDAWFELLPKFRRQGSLEDARHWVEALYLDREYCKAEIETVKTQLASTKETLDFTESARADWSSRYVWLMHEVCDALGIDKDNTPAVDMVLCVRNLMQRDTRSLKLINVELLAALKTILGINFYGNTVRDGIALTDGGDHFLRNVDASIAKAEETNDAVEM